MLLSLNLLKKYLDLPRSITPEKIQLGLTKSTVEVEKLHDQGKNLENIVVGQIKKIEKIPGADKLRLTRVDIGESELLQIVCGGSNLYEGMFSAVAKAGAMVRWHGQGDLVRIEKAKLRGVESQGMICTASEIGLGNEFLHQEAEVMDLKLAKLKPGLDLKTVLGLDDVVIEIDNKSLTNRPDLWSHYGMARELSVIFGSKLKQPKSSIDALKSRKVGCLSVGIDEKKLCQRYLGAVIENVSIGESPEWLKKHLTACGLRPINNIVDITNYVLIEFGQPMHAFDFNKLKPESQKSTRQPAGKIQNKVEINVRLARLGEKITTIDGLERKLEKDSLVIADSEKPVALAGIMGGLETGVSQETKTIVLESANFDAVAVRKTSQKLGLRTEASVRYEKSLHPNLAELGMQRALELIKQVCQESKLIQITDANNFSKKEKAVELDYDFLVKRIGIDIGKAKTLKILQSLGFKTTFHQKTEKLRISIPWWRATGDVSIPEDIVEEVARIYGYDRLLAKQELVNLEPAKYQPRYDFELKIKNLLSVGCGMAEVYNYPWTDSLILEKLGIKEKLVEILNPPTEKNKFLKNSLVFGLLQNAEDNLRFFDSFSLFELSRVFSLGKGKFDGNDNLPCQPYKISGVVVGDKKSNLFFETKGVVKGITDLALAQILPRASFKAGNLPEFLDQEKSQGVFCVNDMIGYLGVLNPGVCQRFDFRNKQVVLFELDFNLLERSFSEKQTAKYKPLAKFPAILRDLAVEVDNSVVWQDLRQVVDGVYEKEDSLWANVDSFLSAFDLGNNKKSVAFRMKYSAGDRTLTDKEVVEIENKILKKLEIEFGAKQRQ